MLQLSSARARGDTEKRRQQEPERILHVLRLTCRLPSLSVCVSRARAEETTRQEEHQEENLPGESCLFLYDCLLLSFARANEETPTTKRQRLLTQPALSFFQLSIEKGKTGGLKVNNPLVSTASLVSLSSSYSTVAYFSFEQEQPVERKRETKDRLMSDHFLTAKFPLIWGCRKWILMFCLSLGLQR